MERRHGRPLDHMGQSEGRKGGVTGGEGPVKSPVAGDEAGTLGKGCEGHVY